MGILIKLHVVMFPWLAFGQMIPYLELAKLIAQSGHRVSFLSTPRNIHRLPKLHPNLASFITFLKLPLPHLPDLPENAETTANLPYNKVQYLQLAHDLLQEPIARFLGAGAPDWVPSRLYCSLAGPYHHPRIEDDGPTKGCRGRLLLVGVVVEGGKIYGDKAKEMKEMFEY